MGYIPRKDSELATWAKNFAAHLGKDPARYGLSCAEAQEIQALVQTFAQAYARAAAPDSRSASAVRGKDAAAKAMLKVLRPCAMLIKGRRNVAAADKVNLGLNIAPPSRARLPVPSSRPLLSVESGQPLCHVLRFCDSESGRRPRGAAGLQLFCYLGEKAQPAVAEGRFVTVCRRSLYRHEFPFSAAGQRAHYWARWHTNRGQYGPWSLRVSLVVAG